MSAPRRQNGGRMNEISNIQINEMAPGFRVCSAVPHLGAYAKTMSLVMLFAVLPGIVPRAPEQMAEPVHRGGFQTNVVPHEIFSAR